MTRRVEALRAMAEQDVSPFERDIARTKLAEMGDVPPPPRPPAPPAAPGYGDEFHVWHFGNGTVNVGTENTISATFMFTFTTAGTNR